MTERRHADSWIAVTLLAIALPFVGGCSREPPAQTRRPLYYRSPMDRSVTSPVPAKDSMGMAYLPVYAEDVAPGELALSAAAIQRLGVGTRAVLYGPLPLKIRAAGSVQYDARTVREIRMRAEGWIEELAVHTAGETVRAGQLLFEFYSPRLQAAIDEYVSTVQFGDAARIALSKRRMRDLGFEEEFIAGLRQQHPEPRRIPFHAPAAGVVTALDVRQGSYVSLDTVVVRMAALDPVWVIAQVSPEDLKDLAPGKLGRIASEVSSDPELEGKIDYIYPELDAATRLARVRLLVHNEHQLLKPGMYVRVSFPGLRTQPVLHVPLQAVIRDGRADHVIVALEGGRFVARTIQTGREYGDEIVVVSGLQMGERVVSSAVFLLDADAALAPSLERWSAAPSER